MTYSLIGPLVVVADDNIFSQRGISTHDENKWYVRPFNHLAQRGRKFPGSLGEQNSIHALRKQQFNGSLLLRKAVIAIAKQEIVAVLLRSVLRAPNHHREKGVHDVGNDHAYRLRLLLNQAARNKIWTVIQLSNCILDTFPKVLANVTLVVDHGGDREDRYAGLTRNVGDTGGFARFWWFAAF